MIDKSWSLAKGRGTEGKAGDECEVLIEEIAAVPIVIIVNIYSEGSRA